MNQPMMPPVRVELTPAQIERRDAMEELNEVLERVVGQTPADIDERRRAFTRFNTRREKAEQMEAADSPLVEKGCLVS